MNCSQKTEDPTRTFSLKLVKAFYEYQDPQKGPCFRLDFGGPQIMLCVTDEQQHSLWRRELGEAMQMTLNSRTLNKPVSWQTWSSETLFAIQDAWQQEEESQVEATRFQSLQLMRKVAEKLLKLEGGNMDLVTKCLNHILSSNYFTFSSQNSPHMFSRF